MIIAFISIKYFLNFQKCTEISFFIKDLGDEIDTAWNSEKSEFVFKSKLPNNIEYVCFANLSAQITNPGTVKDDIYLYRNENANLFLYPTLNACDIPYHNIEHINLDEIISSENPYCIEVKDGKAIFNIKKERGSYLVDITR